MLQFYSLTVPIAAGMCEVSKMKSDDAAIVERYIASVYITTGNCEMITVHMESKSSSADNFDRYRTYIGNFM